MTCQVYIPPYPKLGKSNHLQIKDLPSLYSSAFKLGKSNYLQIKDLPSLYSSIPETWQVKLSTNQRLAKFIFLHSKTWQVKLPTNQRLAKFTIVIASLKGNGCWLSFLHRDCFGVFAVFYADRSA